MNIIEESEAECLSLLDKFLPYLIIISFAVGYHLLGFFNNLVSDLQKPKIKKIYEFNELKCQSFDKDKEF